MCDRKYNIILNGKQSIDLPNNKIVRNKLNNIQTIISQDDNEEQKKHLQTKIEDLKLLIQEKKEKQIHYNNLRKNEAEKFINHHQKIKNENNPVPSPSLFGESLKIPDIIGNRENSTYIQSSSNSKIIKDDYPKGHIKKKVYENHRLMVSKLRNDIYQGFGTSEDLIEEKVHYHFH